MSNTASSLAQELLSGHVLMMQCGASALCILDRIPSTDAAQFELRAGDEAIRMAGLSARLMRYHTTGVQLLHRLPPAARASAPVPSGQPASGTKAEAAAAVRKLHADPGLRRGQLKNGNPAGDYLKSPRCGARTRAGGCCRQPAMANGRCRMHGGLSTGPRTPEGLARCRATRLVHGYRTRAHLALRRRAVHAARRLRTLTADLRASAAGHGVHRSDCRGQRTDDRGRKASRPGAALKRSVLDVPPGTFCPPSSDICPPPAGHGVHRSDSAHHRDTEAQSARVRQGFPASLSSSVSLRLCGESFDRAATLSAWHGVDRSNRDRLRSSAALAPMRNFVLQSVGGLR
jgi:hypothetical protein